MLANRVVLTGDIAIMIEARIRPLPTIAVAMALAAASLSAPLAAQNAGGTGAPGSGAPGSGAPASAPATEVRLKKVEAEVRALQRKVFPDGAGKFFEPEIAPPGTTRPVTPLAPSGAAGTELIARIDAVEAALARATAQAEETANRMGKLEARLAALEAEAGAPASTSPVAVTAPPPRTSITGTVGANTAAMSAASTAPAKPSAARIAAVSAIEKPVSTDKGEDEYLYGYRLWEAKFFPEAVQQLKATTEKYPKHKRISHARNLLGRAWLDDGKPGTAAPVFLQNYQADKAGDRAPDSLLYLAVAMTKLKETPRACVVLAEFAEVYPRDAAGRLATQYASAKAGVKCN